jgi:hypothetical protein
MLERFFAETIMEIVYGYPVKDHQDKFLKIVATAMHAFSQCGQAGKFYVEVFPFCEFSLFRYRPPDPLTYR